MHPEIWSWSALKDVHENEKHELHADTVSHHLSDEIAAKDITQMNGPEVGRVRASSG